MRRGRIPIVALVLSGIGAIVLLRLFQLQVLEADEWRAEAELLAARQRTLPFRRGAIFDRTGRPIAFDEDTFSIDFEYRAFRMRNALAQATHALSVLSHARPQLFREPPTLLTVARDSESSVKLLLQLTAAQVAELPNPSERLEFRQAIEQLLTLDRSGNKAPRLQFREAIRGRDARPIRAVFPEFSKMAPARVAEAADDLEGLDVMLGSVKGTTLEHVESERLDIYSDVESSLARRIEAEGDGEAFDISEEREKTRRQRETWLVRFASGVSYEAAEWVSYRTERFAGFTAGASTVRRYTENLLPWFVGSVRMRNAEELRRARDDEAALDVLARQLFRDEKEQKRFERLKESVARQQYPPGDPCGVDGVEREYEAVLHGARGSVIESVGRRGGHADHVEIVAPKDGKNIELALDVNLQRAAEEILHDGVSDYGGGFLRGALVVIDVNTGDVLACAAQPDFVRDDLKDKDRFAKLLRIDNDSKNPQHPLHHRGYRPWLPPTPGSTFKIVTALAALEEGIVKIDTNHRCEGKVGTLRCDGVHGDIDLMEAMEVSCNAYFGWLGEKLGLAKLRRHSERFGFAEKTAFDRTEVKGGFEIDSADAELLRRCGVGYQIGVTPLQVARAYAALANGGRVLRLRSVRRIDGVDCPVEVVKQLGYRQSDRDSVKDSVRRVVFGARGTARDAGLTEFHVAGKTGTAEVDSKRDLNHAWFAGYAPFDNPRIAFAVYAELVPLHGKDVAPMIRAILKHPTIEPYLDNP